MIFTDSLFGPGELVAPTPIVGDAASLGLVEPRREVAMRAGATLKLQRARADRCVEESKVADFEVE